MVQQLAGELNIHCEGCLVANWEDEGFHTPALPELLSAVAALASGSQAKEASGAPFGSDRLPASPEGRAVWTFGSRRYHEGYFLGGEGCGVFPGAPRYQWPVRLGR